MVTDIRSFKIPNWLILTGYAIGFYYRYYTDGVTGIASAMIGAILPILYLYPIFLIRGLGAGDIKLFSVIGIYLNMQEMITCIIAAIFLGGILSILQIIRKCISKRQGKFVKTNNKGNVIHFSIPILISVMLHIGGVY